MQRQCPACPLPLARFTLKGLRFHSCPEHGILVPAENLKAFFKDPELADSCLAHLNPSSESVADTERRCPECRNGFQKFTTKTFSHVWIDVCRRCRVYWFDQGEWESVKSADFHPGVGQHLPRERVKFPSGGEDFVSLRIQGNLAGMFIPLEESQRVKRRPPIVTVFIIAFAAIITGMALKNYGLYERWVYDPAQPFRNLGMSQLTGLLLHGSWRHWFSNSAFLWMVGDDVEDEAGHWEFFKLFALSGAAGSLFYSFMGGSAPSVGMSGAVSGVMLYYAIRFPNHRFTITRLYPSETFKFSTVGLSVAAPALMVLYFASDLIGLWWQYEMGGGGRVNYAAHVGGAVTGMAYAFFTKK